MARSSAAKKNEGPKAVPPQARPAASGATKTGATVTVACKMPNGIVIHRERPSIRRVPVLGGGIIEEKSFERVPGSEVMIFGTARPLGAAPRTRTVGGYALTANVPKDTWDQWYEAHKDLPAIVNGLIYAMESVEDAAAEARDNAKIRSGLEPMLPDGDPRAPRPTDPHVSTVTANDEVTHDFAEVDEE